MKQQSKRQAVNPYLPLYEYIPDGEPHVFGDRLYLYGSHDRFDGRKFCENDYVCWSAPVTDLADWRYEGVIYHRTQDPRMPHGEHELWAPDVVQGKDGRYYLYYCPDDKVKSIGVAVCDTPAGHYMFYGVVRDREGGILGERPGDTIPFDPGVFRDEDGTTRIQVTVRGRARGRLLVRLTPGGEPVGAVDLVPARSWTAFSGLLSIPDGDHTLCLCYEGKGRLDFLEFSLS